MRSAAFLLGLILAAAGLLFAGDAGEWLDRASDAGVSVRRREYAAQRLLMLADQSASILIAAVKGTDGRDGALRRQVAARLLGVLDIPEAEAALLEAHFGRDYFLSRAAGTALVRLYSRLPDGKIYTLLTKGARELGDIPGGTPPGEDDWLGLSLRDATHRGRFKALVMRGLAEKYAAEPSPLPEPLVWCVWDALLDVEPALRTAALALLPRIADARATEKLAAFLYTESNPAVLAFALGVMAEMRPPQYGGAVERQALHADPMVALEAMAALDAMGYPQALVPATPGARSVATFVNHPSTPVRARAIEILSASRNPAAAEHLVAALFDRVGANRAAAARALGEAGHSPAVGSLNPLLRDGRPEVRREAAVALAGFGVVGVASTMVDELRGASLPFRVAAAEALGRIGDERAVPALSEALRSGEFDLVCVAAEALGLMKARGGVPGLFALMRESGDEVAADAARRALEAISGDDPGDAEASWKEWESRNAALFARP